MLPSLQPPPLPPLSPLPQPPLPLRLSWLLPPLPPLPPWPLFPPLFNVDLTHRRCHCFRLHRLRCRHCRHHHCCCHGCRRCPATTTNTVVGPFSTGSTRNLIWGQFLSGELVLGWRMGYPVAWPVFLLLTTLLGTSRWGPLTTPRLILPRVLEGFPEWSCCLSSSVEVHSYRVFFATSLPKCRVVILLSHLLWLVPTSGCWVGVRRNYFCGGHRRRCNVESGNALPQACINVWMMGGVQRRLAKLLNSY